jgi:hypothetical protein
MSDNGESEIGGRLLDGWAGRIVEERARLAIEHSLRLGGKRVTIPEKREMAESMVWALCAFRQAEITRRRSQRYTASGEAIDREVIVVDGSTDAGDDWAVRLIIEEGAR